MNDTQLAKLSYQELLETQNKIASAIVKRRAEERRDVKAKIAALAASSGFDVEELMGTGKRGSVKGSKVAAKFANPKDPTQTWTGRGRKPLWMVAELKKGKKMEAFAL